MGMENQDGKPDGGSGQKAAVLMPKL